MKRVAVATGILLLCLMRVTYACSESALKLKNVSSHLTVVVTHRDVPIAGVAISVVREGDDGKEVFSGSTDRRGSLQIPPLADARYFVRASFLGIDVLTEWIQVLHRSDSKTPKRLDIRWADWSDSTRQVAGTLSGRVPGNTGNRIMDIARSVETVYPGVEMILKSALSEDEYHTLSDSSGAFLFGNVPDGIYVLTIPGGMKSATGVADITTMVIDVTNKAKRDSMRLRLEDTGCYRTEFQLKEE